MPTLLLVDGSSYLYRAFHALPDLRNQAGEPTGAVYGVLAMLRRLLGDYKADYRACIFDAKGPTFRDEWYPDYKAHRPPMAEDLVRQIAPLHACIRAQGWPLLSIPGVEADDVIGTLARQASRQGMEVVISTGDKDLAQLVDGRTRLVNTMTNEILDEAGVLAKFGVPPTLIVDYLALIGDTSDNVPGVEKCGPKTALKWLGQYGDLAGVMAHADAVGGVVGQNLRRALSFLPLGQKLVTVVCDLALPLKPEELIPAEPDKGLLLEWFEKLDFKTWRNELAGQESGIRDQAPESATVGDEENHRQAYETILTWEALDTWLARIEASPLTSFDTETTSLEAMNAHLVGMSFSVATGQAAYLPLGHHYAGAPEQLPLEDVLEKLKPWLESGTQLKLGQNLKYDRHVLANHGIRLSGIAHDTLLQSYILESGHSHDLESLCKRHLGLEVISYADVAGKGASQIGFEQVAVEKAAEYAAEDADVTLRVHQALMPQLQAEPQLASLYRDMELPVAEVLFRMERNGILISPELLAIQSRELGERMMEVEQQAFAAAKQPFNISSPKQIGEILYDREKLPILKKTPGGAPSTDEEVLQQLALDYPLPKLILEYRGLAKLKNTYTDKLPRMIHPATGRVHTSFSQAVAVTGRLSSSDPNLQNIPVRTAEGRRIRAAFIASPGSRIVSADYSQIELRIMAHLSNDERLLDAFAKGEDVHRATAGEIFGVSPAEVSSDQRRAAKVINFGLIYRMSAFGLAKSLDMDRTSAQAYMDRYFARYPGVARYMETTRQEAKQKGYVETVFGRRLWLPDLKSGSPGRRQGAERAAINAPMQGTAADLIKRAMIAVQNWLDTEKLTTRLVLQVHDELVLEVPDEELPTLRRHLPGLMENVAQLAVPLLVEVGAGDNWDEAH